ncbi:hypothetical protein ABZW96_08065 [Nocardia sp. NPDC004168]|uniref:hypothetical protein n=1 Tax=Nocardia TaxID=1817 RepID=UPI0033B38AE2
MPGTAGYGRTTRLDQGVSWVFRDHGVGIAFGAGSADDSGGSTRLSGAGARTGNASA